MQAKLKPSISSRTSVRGLIIACMPAAALGIIANSPALGAVFSPLTDQGATTDYNASTNSAAPHAPSTNSSSAGTNSGVHYVTEGLRG